MNIASSTGIQSANSSGYANPDSVVGPKGQLSKDAFLQLLVAQLKNQDPLQPMDSSQFVSQLAQFSALEQMSNVAAGQEKTATATEVQAATQWMGKRISYLDDQGNVQSGIAQGVQLKDGSVYLNVGGRSIPWSSVWEVEDGPAAPGSGSGTGV